MELTIHFFFNLAIILIILFLALVYGVKRRNLLTKTSSIVWCTLMILACFIFSYHPLPDITMDLRELPVLIGGIYLGIGPILSLIVIVIRGFYGLDSGFFANLALYLPLGLILWKTYPWFWKQTPRRRVIVTIIIGIIISLFTLVCLEFMNLNVNRLDAYLAYLLVPPLGIAMISITAEFIIYNYHLQNRLIKSGKLEIVEQMGAAISHEIRNPLTSARGFVQLLLEGSVTHKKNVEYLTIISQELDLAEQVIRNYLTYSKPHLEQVERIDVLKELSLIVNMLKPTANQYSVALTTEFQTLSYILGDRQKFNQCFLNVIKNGIESMPKGGELIIKTEIDKKSLRVIVKDNGVGMTKEQLDRLGEPYYSTKGPNGTGLGMMVVYSIVRAMNGMIRVKSEVGVGTTFVFSFPLKKVASEE